MISLLAVIFDIDGTLVDSVDYHAEAWRQAFASFGHGISLTDIRSQIGKGGDQLMPVFLSAEEVKEKGKDIEAERGKIFQREFKDRVKPFAGVRPLFARLHRDGLRIALASSAKKEELQHYVELLDIGDLIEAGTSTDDAEKSKPHPDIFEAALGKLGGIDPAQAIAVGDTPYDAEAAGKAGMATVGVLCGGFAEADLRAAGAIEIFQGPCDLLERYYQSRLGGG